MKEMQPSFLRNTDSLLFSFFPLMITVQRRGPKNNLCKVSVVIKAIKSPERQTVCVELLWCVRAEQVAGQPHFHLTLNAWLLLSWPSV